MENVNEHLLTDRNVEENEFNADPKRHLSFREWVDRRSSKLTKIK